MPPVVDLEALVCGGDRKIVCETTLNDPAGEAKQVESPLSPPPPPLDEPAESFRVPIGEEIDWVSRNAAAVYDRDDSTKEITNPKSQQHHNTTNVKLSSSSQRYSAKPKAPIIALPNKLRHSGYLGRSSRRHSANIRIFPKKACGAPQRGKSAVPESEPTSPKVSCIGRVLSDRDRNRRRKAQDKGPSDVSREPSSVAASSDGRSPRRHRAGFWSIFGFSCCGQGIRSTVIDEEKLPSSRTTRSTTKHKTTSIISESDAGDDDAAPSAPAPGLGGMMRFASGRRPASWGGDLEQDAQPVSKSGPLPAKQQGAGILDRRSAAVLEDLDLDRNWESSGPASI